MNPDYIQSKLESIELGETLIAPWEDIFVWTEDCVRPSQLESLLKEGDPLCDAAIASIYDCASGRPGSHTDLLDSLQTSSHPSCVSFTSAITSTPPPSIAASPCELARGRDFFNSYSIPILQSLLHISLACGLASPQINKTLRQVSHLTPPCPFLSANSRNSRIVHRLLETVQFVIDICGGDNSQGGQGLDDSWTGEAWKSAIRVRMLHAFVRRRIYRKDIGLSNSGISGNVEGDADHRCPFQSSNNSVIADEVPINQAELAVTLASFCVAPLLGLERMGFVGISSREKNDFIAIWRHYGWFLGISESILKRHFASFDTAYAFMCSVATWMLEVEGGDTELEKQPAPAPVVQILWALSNNDRMSYFSFDASCALTRQLVGDSMADRLGLPQVSYWSYWKMRLGIAITNGPIYLGESKLGLIGSWNGRRKSLMNFILPIAIAWLLGWQRTLFAPSTGTKRFIPFLSYSQTVSPIFLLCHILFKWTLLHIELFLLMILPFVPYLLLNYISPSHSFFEIKHPFPSQAPSVLLSSRGLSHYWLSRTHLLSLVFYRFS